MQKNTIEIILGIRKNIETLRNLKFPIEHSNEEKKSLLLLGCSRVKKEICEFEKLYNKLLEELRKHNPISEEEYQKLKL